MSSPWHLRCHERWITAVCMWYWIWRCWELVLFVVYRVWTISCGIRNFNRYPKKSSIAASIFIIISPNTSSSDLGLGQSRSWWRAVCFCGIFSTISFRTVGYPSYVARLILMKRLAKCWGGILGFHVSLLVSFESWFLSIFESIWRSVKLSFRNLNCR